jgi:hypothetical protein
MDILGKDRLVGGKALCSGIHGIGVGDGIEVCHFIDHKIMSLYCYFDLFI